MMKTILLLVLLFVAGNIYAQKYSKVKIYADQDGISRLAAEGVAVDHGIRKQGYFLITDLSEEDIQQVGSMDFQYEVLIDDVQKFYVQQNQTIFAPKNAVCSAPSASPGGNVPENFQVPSTYGGYFKYNEMLQELDEMAVLYPHLISVKAPIHTYLTWENRPIYHVKISNNPTMDDGDPKVLYSAVHHAREPLSMSQLIYYMWYLLENYDTNPEVKFLVDNTQLFFVPCVNPDGYIYNETTNPNGGGMHRKNRNPGIGTTNKGVDINRNYSYGWGTTGVSTNQNNDTYPGTSAFSEPETQAMRWLVQNHTIQSALNAHTYGDMLLFPIGTTTAEYADHHDYFQGLCNHLTEYNGYEASKSSGLYPASGDSDDYMYKVDNGVLQKDTIFAMTPEIGGSFWPASSEILPTCQEMVFVNLGVAHMVHKYYIVKEDDPLEIEAMTGSFHHTVKRMGRENGTATVSLEPIFNLAAVGSPVTYDLQALEESEGLIAYELNAGIESGDSVIYVLTTNDGNWIQRDTIIKLYGGGYTVVFSDNADNTTNWMGNWTTSSSIYYSPSQSFTDSPGNYPNNTTRTTTYADEIDLTAVVSAKATFYARWEIEKNYDYCQFQVSVDDGNSWIGQCGLYTNPGSAVNGSIQPAGEPLWDGNRTDWVQEQIDLSDYTGQVIQVRFMLRSDGGVRADGFYFDDFRLLTSEEEEEGPTEPEPGVGLNELSAGKILIYPNPSSGIFVIEGAGQEDRVEIMDVRGIVVYRSVIQSAGEPSGIAASSLSPGTYFVRISGEKGNSVHQLVIGR